MKLEQFFAMWPGLPRICASLALSISAAVQAGRKSYGRSDRACRSYLALPISIYLPIAEGDLFGQLLFALHEVPLNKRVCYRTPNTKRCANLLQLQDASAPSQRAAGPYPPLVALACGATVENAAQSAQVSPRTAHRRLSDPAFKDYGRFSIVTAVCSPFSWKRNSARIDLTWSRNLPSSDVSATRLCRSGRLCEPCRSFTTSPSRAS